MAEHFLGIDLGGTKVLTAVADERGKILARKKIPTEPEKGQEHVIDNIIGSVLAVLEESGLDKSEIVRTGIGSPGPLNIEKGIIYLAPNLGWENVPISALLEERLGVPIKLENDANAAALGEKWFGAGQGIDNLLYITVSTGIGGGIIIDQKIYHGANAGAGEVGHMIIDPDGPRCGCGNRGCLEALASGTAIIRMAREAVKSGQETILHSLSDGDVTKISGSLIAEAARMGDQVAEDIWEKAGDYLGLGVANLVNVFNPEMIIFGGGVMKAGAFIMKPMLRSLKKRAFKESYRSLKIKQAALGNDVGVKGAIAVAMGDSLEFLE